MTLTSSKSEYSEQVGFYYYVQYNLHLQLSEATKYVACAKFFLLPILLFLSLSSFSLSLSIYTPAPTLFLCLLTSGVLHRYAFHKGVALKGDIAIGVNPKSVDPWIEPRLFNLDKSTGAPPDFFCKCTAHERTGIQTHIQAHRKPRCLATQTHRNAGTQIKPTIHFAI